VEFEVFTVSGGVRFTQSLTQGSGEMVELLPQPATDTVAMAAVSLELAVWAEQTVASMPVKAKKTTWFLMIELLF
jgi:hypothetical protein